MRPPEENFRLARDYARLMRVLELRMIGFGSALAALAYAAILASLVLTAACATSPGTRRPSDDDVQTVLVVNHTLDALRIGQGDFRLGSVMAGRSECLTIRLAHTIDLSYRAIGQRSVMWTRVPARPGSWRWDINGIPADEISLAPAERCR